MDFTIKQKIRRKVLAASTLPFSLVSKRGFLKEMGWFKSVATGIPSDKNGQPIPWWSYSFIYFLQDRLNTNMTVFEFGSGNSTLWLAKHVKHVISIETEKKWYEYLKDIVPSNVELKHVKFDWDDYYQEANSFDQQFDIVIVDNRDRVRCTKFSVSALSSKGVIILDDSENPSFQEARDYLSEGGFMSLDFIGTDPTHDGTHCTTVFYRDQNCLGI